MALAAGYPFVSSHRELWSCGHPEEKAGAWAGSAGIRSTEICPSRQPRRTVGFTDQPDIFRRRSRPAHHRSPPRDQTRASSPLCRSNGDAHVVRAGCERSISGARWRLKEKAANAGRAKSAKRCFATNRCAPATNCHSQAKLTKTELAARQRQYTSCMTYVP